MTITDEQLKILFPRCKQTSLYAVMINRYSPEFGITTAMRMCHFLAQIGVESAGMTAVSENLNYSAQGLLKTFPKYFDKATAEAYARNPKKIANRVYANRMGNGTEGSGDGYKYRGRGFIQTTGKSNYKAYNAYLTESGVVVDLLKQPELLEQPVGATKSAMWYWKQHGCNELADKNDIVTITKKINGGSNGLTQRMLYLAKAKKLLRVN